MTKLNKKFVADFEEWLQKYTEPYLWLVNNFWLLPFSFQQGVFVEFLREKEITISIESNYHCGMTYVFHVNKNLRQLGEHLRFYETYEICFETAIIKASEIYGGNND